jgi:hypothetical protein
MKAKTEKTNEFTALGDDGHYYRVTEFTEYLNVTTVSDTQPQWMPGKTMLRLDNGDSINLIDENNFEIVRTGIHLHKPRNT